MDDCADGNGGTYKKDESIEAIELKTSSGNRFQAGEEVEISVLVYAYGDGSKSVLDLWYADDASDPVWKHIGTLHPNRGGLLWITDTYFVLPNSRNAQAVRAVFRYDHNAAAAESTCPAYKYYTDHDTLSIVTAESEGLEKPTDGETVDGDGSTERQKRQGGKKKKKNHED